MTYSATPIPDGLWGVDCDFELTDAVLDVLLATDLHGLVAAAAPGSHPRVLVRYEGLHGPARGDITLTELQRILARPERPILLIVQHVLGGSWTASGALGTQHGQAAVANAKLAGYDASLYGALSLICDLESVANPGPAVLSYVEARMAATDGGAFGRALYKGFDDGLTGQQLLDLLCPLWAAPGQATLPSGATFAAIQHGTIKIGGNEYDADQFSVDSRGYSFVGLQDVQYVADVEDTDPHIDLTGTKDV